MRTVIVLAGAAVLLAGCSSVEAGYKAGSGQTDASPAASSAVAAASSAAGACNLKTTQDMILRDRTPSGWTAVLIGDVNIIACKPSTETLVVPSGVGYCEQIARAKDNPGYDVDAKPAKPLRHVLKQVGESCA